MDQGGTPKLGYDCTHCLDWHTLTVVDTIADGVTAVRNIPCPSCRPALAAPLVCRCDQSGPVEVAIADTVVITDRVCILHDGSGR